MAWVKREIKLEFFYFLFFFCIVTKYRLPSQPIQPGLQLSPFSTVNNMRIELLQAHLQEQNAVIVQRSP